MPRRKAGPSRRQQQRLWQIGEFWLAQEAGTAFIVYCWYDTGARRVRRRTTGATGPGDAKLFRKGFG
jgi:hypothetical protein